MACDTSSSIFVASTSKKDPTYLNLPEPLFSLANELTDQKSYGMELSNSISLTTESQKDQARQAEALKHLQ